MSQLQLAIVTPEGKTFEGPIDSVVAPGTLGLFGVFPGHAPMISSLEIGTVAVRAEFQEKLFVVEGGFLEVHENQVVILAAHAEPVGQGASVEDILQRRREARAQAAPART